MSTVNERDAMRRALHAAVDHVEVSADGLERIRARLSPPRPVAVAWADAAWTDLRMRVPTEGQRFVEWLLRVIALAWERFGPQSGTSGSRTARALGWLRPAAALGVTVFIVAAGAYVAIDAQQAIFPSSSNAPGSTNGGTGTGGRPHGGPGGPNALGSSPLNSPGATRTPPKSCAQSRSAAPSTSKPTGQSSSPAASPSDSTTPSSPSPSVTASSTPTPGVSPTVQAGSQVGGVSASVAARTNGATLTRYAAASPSPSPCTTKRSSRGSGGSTPRPSAAVISLGKLADGS